METWKPETEPIPILATGTQDKMAQLWGGDRESEGTRTEQSGERKTMKKKSMVSQNVKKENEREMNERLGSLVSEAVYESDHTVWYENRQSCVHQPSPKLHSVKKKALFF